jgi:hypothetical protein
MTFDYSRCYLRMDCGERTSLFYSFCDVDGPDAGMQFDTRTEYGL